MYSISALFLSARLHTKMANNLQTVVKMARGLAIAHIVVGALLICFGIADYLTQVGVSFFAGYIFFGVWIGVWVSHH